MRRGRAIVLVWMAALPGFAGEALAQGSGKPGLYLSPFRAAPVDSSTASKLDDLRKIWEGAPAPTPPGQGLKPAPGSNGKIGTRVYIPDGPAPGTIATRPATSLPQTVAAGSVAPNNPFLLTVAIEYLARGARDGDTSLCTGIIVGPHHVLTAGHCACGEPSSYTIIVDDDVRNTPPPLRDALAVPPSLYDARVCTEKRLWANDLALLTLKQPFQCEVALSARQEAQFDNSLGLYVWNGQPAPGDCRDVAQQADPRAPARTFGVPEEKFFDLRNRFAPGTKLRAVGYGITDRYTKGRRMWADIPIASADCTERFWSGTCAPFAELVLAHPLESRRRSDTCGGDSGGPVYLMENDSFTLVGITSRPAPGPHEDARLQCGGGGIYTLIGRSSVHNWLLANGVGKAVAVAR